MPYKISGTKSETARIIVMKESDWSIESNTVISGSGSYEIEELIIGDKSVIARTVDGEVIGYGNTTSVFYELPTAMIFDADNKTTYITLSPNELEATCTYAGAGGQNVVVERGRSSGKYYFEMEFDTLTGNKQDFIGIRELPLSSSYPGKVDGASYSAYNERIQKNDTSYDTDSATPAPGAIIGIAVDFDNLKAFWSLNNVWMSFSGGNSNPVTGVDPLYNLSAATTYYAAASFYANTGTIKLFADDSLIYTPPSGYSAW